MAEHFHHQHRDAGQDHTTGQDHAAELADFLDLDAKVLGTYLGQLTEWAGQHAPDETRAIVDLGAGTGSGSLALAQRFEAAEIVAIDKSALMLERLGAAAREQGLAGRLRLVQADLDQAWPEVGSVDVAWAASSLHEVADPDQVLRDVYAALRPGGLLAVVEMDTLPRFLPDDVGLGRPGLESRCHEALAQAGWNAHPDWRSHLERAGFDVAAQRSFPIEATSATSSIGRYASAFLRRIRLALEGKISRADLDTLDQLLADDSPHGILHRNDLTIRGSRTAWAALRR
ncbi:class I SAM-dependent methyltransferase [Saxibacter everestensis]|uniref:Class I SAM-dependent methyltransferase n=1 Tax=Saxibacter everestensis TaxID=2909229 RepID=A0ABY8QY33_9MICO|nr:class I SAM-dependent methyltransferase [Brevibacteriaceae bacterium ZFBP1038]